MIRSRRNDGVSVIKEKCASWLRKDCFLIVVLLGCVRLLGGCWNHDKNQFALPLKRKLRDVLQSCDDHGGKFSNPHPSPITPAQSP